LIPGFEAVETDREAPAELGTTADLPERSMFSAGTHRKDRGVLAADIFPVFQMARAIVLIKLLFQLKISSCSDLFQTFAQRCYDSL